MKNINKYWKNIYKISRFFSSYTLLLFLCILFLDSCIFSGKYIASYRVMAKNTKKSTKEIYTDYINHLAAKNKFIIDSKYNGTDTLGYYGQPYHYFKFWLEVSEGDTVLRIDYYGSFGSRRNQPYKELFNELNSFMNENFIIIEKEINEENNAKK
jgi:hypothetical protein